MTGDLNGQRHGRKDLNRVATETAVDARLAELQAALTALPRERAQALPALHVVDHVYGYLDHAGLEAVARWLQIPRAELFAVATSYTEFRWSPLAPDTVRACRGLSCQIAAGGPEIEADADAEAHECMFLCAAASDRALRVTGAGRVEDRLSNDVWASGRSEVDGGLSRLTQLRTGRAPDWLGWRAASSMPPHEIVDLVQRAGLRGRGGAYFPVHLKWRGAIDASASANAPSDRANSDSSRPLLVINAEEGEPGIFKDRVLMERDPQRLLEGIRICCYAIGAERAYLYINGMADRSADAMASALQAAEAAGLMDGLTVEIRRGAGGYVCGEESVILESIEGRRAVPRLKPPFPTERGLWGRPTVINNVETLANLPDILEYGAEWFGAVGMQDAPGAKLLSLSGGFANRGWIELPLGTPVSEIIDLAQPIESLAGVAIGGPSGGFLAPANFDTVIGPGSLDGHGAVLGAGGIIAIPQSFGIDRALAVWATYNANESCGKCTPCREGSGRIANALAEGNWADVEALIPLITAGSLCGLGQMAPNPITSARHQFGGSLL